MFVVLLINLLLLGVQVVIKLDPINSGLLIKCLDDHSIDCHNNI